MNEVTIQPISAQCSSDIEVSHLFCATKQVTGFYIKCSIGLK